MILPTPLYRLLRHGWCIGCMRTRTIVEVITEGGAWWTGRCKDCFPTERASRE